MFREAVNNMEKHLIDSLQKSYVDYDTRLQESLHKLLELNNNEKVSDEEKDKTLNDVEGTLCIKQKYELTHPNFQDARKWINNTLSTEINFDVNSHFPTKCLESACHVL